MQDRQECLQKEAKKYESKITIYKDEKSAEVTRLMALMALGTNADRKYV